MVVNSVSDISGNSKNYYHCMEFRAVKCFRPVELSYGLNIDTTIGPTMEWLNIQVYLGVNTTLHIFCVDHHSL